MTTNIRQITPQHWLTAGLCLLLGLPAMGQAGGGARGGGRAGAGGAGGATTTRDYPPVGTVGSATYSVDQENRTLTVIGDTNTVAAVTKAMAALDRPKPQVMIKVVFLEVTYNNGVDIGLEGNFTKGVSSRPPIGLGLTNAFGLVQQGITPTPNVNTLPGAGLYSVVGSDFTATVRAIQEIGKVSILSRPTILARNNQQANIVVGQQVPLITGVSFDTFGNEHSSITYQNVGIILTVTPFITRDDNVEMILAPQISEVASQSTQISGGTNGSFSTPYINIRSANTVVVTPNGQTVVIGGLMQDSKTSTDSKIPGLGDIPLIGALFHHKLIADAKTELIIFLTPYIVRTPSDLIVVSQDERRRADIPPRTFPEREMNQYLAPTTQPAGSPPSKLPSPHNH